jgi:hypothetical protein
MLIAADVQQIKLVNQANALEHVERAVDGDAVNAGVDFLRAVENCSGVEMLVGAIHDLNQNSALASEADSFGGKRGLQAAGTLVSVDSFSAGDALSAIEGHVMTSLARHFPYCNNNFLGVLEKAQNVIVHDESEDDQDEDESNLDEAFLGFDAEVVAQCAFYGKHGDVSAVENWERQ